MQARVLVMRDVDGLSYREIGERLHMGRPAVERTLMGARNRLESEYEQLSEGRRCALARGAIVRLAEGEEARGDQYRLARHARRCSTCRRLAREMGVEPLQRTSLRQKLAGLLPLPWTLSTGGGGAGALGGLASERVAALVAAVAIAGAGGAALEVTHDNGPPADRLTGTSPAAPTGAPVERGASQPGTTAARDVSRARRPGQPARRRAERRRRPGAQAGPAAGAPQLQDGGAAQAPPPAGPAEPSPAPSLPTRAAPAPKVQVPAVKAPQLPVPQVGTPAPGETLPPVTVPQPAPPIVNDTVEGVRDTVNGLVP